MRQKARLREMTPRKVPADAKLTLGVIAVLTVLGTLVGDLAFGAFLTPLVYLLGTYAMSRMTMRDSMLSLMFLTLVLQDPNDGSPVRTEIWSPPFTGAGGVLLSHLNAVGRPLGSFGWASFSLMDLFLVTLVGIDYLRRTTRSKLDSVERITTPRPILRLAALATLGTLFTWLWGLATGGDFGKSLWQLNRVMYLPLLVYLFHLALRGPQDLAPLLKVLLSAAVYKSLLALYVVATVVVPADPFTGATRPAHATSHQDSILFATAFATLLVLVLERVGGAKRAIRLAALLLPILAAGMWANNRRTAWVQVGMVFFTVYLMTAQNPVKRAFQRALLMAAPFASLYVWLGWGRGGTLFKPVQVLRSVVDAKSDGSSNWRELENFDIMQTLKANPIFGTGYGHGFYEIIKLPAVGYDLEIYCPHNSLLGIWAFAGVVGYTCLTLLWIAGVYFAVRTYHGAREPELRAAALVIVGAVVIYIIQCWADLGIGMWIGVFIVAPAFVMAGKLAVYTGQWPGSAATNAAVGATREPAHPPRAHEAARPQ